MNTKYKPIYHRSAVKFLSRQNKRSQDRISTGVKGLLAIPPIGDIRLLKEYKGLYRLRIGDYRIVFNIDHQERKIYILAIGNRGDIYK